MEFGVFEKCGSMASRRLDVQHLKGAKRDNVSIYRKLDYSTI